MHKKEAIGVVPKECICIYSHGDIKFDLVPDNYEDAKRLLKNISPDYSGQGTKCSIQMDKEFNIDKFKSAMNYRDINHRILMSKTWMSFHNLSAPKGFYDKGVDIKNIKTLELEYSNINKYYPHLPKRQQLDLKQQIKIELSKEYAKMEILRKKRFKMYAEKYYHSLELWQVDAFLIMMYEMWNK